MISKALSDIKHTAHCRHFIIQISLGRLSKLQRSKRRISCDQQQPATRSYNMKKYINNSLSKMSMVMDQEQQKSYKGDITHDVAKMST